TGAFDNRLHKFRRDVDRIFHAGHAPDRGVGRPSHFMRIRSDLLLCLKTDGAGIERLETFKRPKQIFLADAAAIEFSDRQLKKLLEKFFQALRIPFGGDLAENFAYLLRSALD